MTAQPLTFQAIKDKALELGFQQIGYLSLPIDQFDPTVNNLKDWLSEGYHADMQWMVTHLEKRAHPETLMDNAKSILCVTMNYNTGAQSPQSQAKIARYAKGDDYHKVIKKRLKTLLQWMQSQDPSIEGRALTDSAPILEKPLAIKAGLGWQGKNSCLITPGIGSWFFIGELFLNVTLDDAPNVTEVSNHCGSCRRCIEACPTDAIVSDGVIDANKCISYWTIEHKGETFPDNIVQNLDKWLFGCDICQDVCPWNIKFEQPTSEKVFEARPWNIEVKLTDILAMDDDSFKTRYQASPIKRTKLAGLQRNARYIADNITSRV